jgi:hypothetical protein
MATTPNRNYPLPDIANDIDQEFYALQLSVLPMIDLDIQSLFDAVAGKAATVHGHTIAQIEGLQAALDDKMAAGATFNLAGLADVVGMAAAPDGYIPVKVGDEVVFQTALSALGDHEQPISSITGLEDALSSKVNASSQWFGTQAAYDAIPSKDPAVTYFIFAA